MRVFIISIVFLLVIKAGYGQGYDFVYYGQYSDDTELSRLCDSMNSPLLVYEGKIYAIGGYCVSRLIDGDWNDRDNDGKSNRRNKKGDNNEREDGGDGNDRDAGGNVGYRKKKGSKNSRNKGGDENDRDADGNADDRDNDGDADARDADGKLSGLPHCSTAKNGKILLYTMKKINGKNATLYYKGKHFSNKYFKIIQL